MNSAPIVNDFVAMVPLNETRMCSFPRCHEYTWWASARQRKNGLCGDHFPQSWYAVPTPELDDRAFMNVLREFPGASIGTYTPPVYPPDTYAGRDAGPCLRCRRRVRRYGPFAYPWCADCVARREESSR